MLLERKDINPEHPDTEYGRTPLSLAAQGGHEGVVKMFLERSDVNPDQLDTESGRTPLSLAVGGGHKEVVKMLLERGDAKPDRADISGKTPLDWGVSQQHVEIVKMIGNSKGQRKLSGNSERPKLFNTQGSVSESAAHNSSVDRSWWSRLFSG